MLTLPPGEILCKAIDFQTTQPVGQRMEILLVGAFETFVLPMRKPRVLIVSPALANANNGNWQTAWRWSRMLGTEFKVEIAQHWDGSPFDVMLALHAKRSAGSIGLWAESKGCTTNAPGLGVVLTGTDLYRDIHSDPLAQRSLEMAQKLVVLQELGVQSLEPAHRGKAQCIFQSASKRQALVKPTRHLRALMVGHLRDEKSPQTLFAAARLLKAYPGIFIDHIGEPLDAELAEQARATAQACHNYRWLGGLPHEATRRRIQAAHLLIHASKMEGGAHVVMEAVCSGTPVLASKIDGNVGMLGGDYPGYFELEDAAGLADLLVRIRRDQSCDQARATPDASHFLITELQAHCAKRAPLFSPAAEQAALITLVHGLLA